MFVLPPFNLLVELPEICMGMRLPEIIRSLTLSGTPFVHLMVTVAHSVFFPPNASANSIRRS